MIIPILVMSAVGIYSWIKGGATPPIPLLPPGKTMVGALSTGLFVVMWNYMGWELPTAAGDEIVNPKHTYPLAMTLVLIAAIASYMLPTIAGLAGGAGADGKYILWGQEEATQGAGIGSLLADNGISSQKIESWGVNPAQPVGWEFPDIAHAIGEMATGQRNSPLAMLLGSGVTFAAVLSMIGLFIGNSLGSSRVPFAMAQDGMMPQWLVKIHPKYGTPWVAILFCGILYSIFSLQTFSFLIVVDVFLNMLVLLAEFLALWKLRAARPDLSRAMVPGGIIGLTLVTISPSAIIFIAIYSQIAEEGFNSLGLAFAAILVGALLYIPIQKYVKRGVPDVNPFDYNEELSSHA